MKTWLRRLLPLLFASAGALFLWTGSLLIPDRYTSYAMVRLEVEPFPATDVINDAFQEIVSRRVLKDLILRLNLYTDERQRLPLEDVIDAVKKDDIQLDVSPQEEVRVAFSYRDPKLAQAAAGSLLRGMVDESGVHARRDPGWGRMEVKSAAGPAELTSSRLAFWREPRYTVAGTLVVRKLDSFQPDLAQAERRAADLKQWALSSRHLEHFASLFVYKDLKVHNSLPDELRAHLRIEQAGSRNVLQLQFTYPDAQVAQRTLSIAVDEMVDKVRFPECEPSVPPPPGYRAVVTDSANTRPGRDISDALSPQLVVATRHAGAPSCGSDKQPAWEHTLDIIDPASLPEEPDGPLRLILSIFGFFLGLGLWITITGK